MRGLSLFEGSVPSDQIKVCNWVPTIKVEPLQDSASRQKTLDLVDLLKSRKFALWKVTHFNLSLLDSILIPVEFQWNSYGFH